MNDNRLSLKKIFSHKGSEVTILDISVLIFGIIMYTVDVASDVYVAFSNWYLHSVGFFITSIIFIILPSVVNNLLNWLWYRENDEELTKMAVFMHLILLSPLMRYIQTLRFAIQAYSKKKDDDVERFFKNLSDLSILQFLEAFLEAGPQLVMQVSVLIPGRYSIPEIRWYRYVSIMVSLISLSWSSVSYHRTRRRASTFTRNDNQILVCCLHFSWTLLLTGARIITLSCFMSVCPLWLLAGCLLHVVFILAFVMPCIGSEILDYSVSDYGLLLFWSFGTIFGWISYHKPAFTFYLFYNLVFAQENVALFATWRGMVGSSVYTFIVCMIFLSCYFFGSMLMLVHYKCSRESVTMLKRGQLIVSGNTVENGHACGEENL